MWLLWDLALSVSLEPGPLDYTGGAFALGFLLAFTWICALIYMINRAALSDRVAVPVRRTHHR